MFNSIVLSHFTYCDSIWASSDETNNSRLQKLQNPCARVILNEKRRSHVQPMLDSLSWMPIIDLIKYHTLVAVYKCTHGLVPSYLHNSFMQISRIHSYSTWQANLAHNNTDIYQICFLLAIKYVSLKLLQLVLRTQNSKQII